MGSEDKDETALALQREINKKDILANLDTESIFTRFPKNPYDSLSQRCYTYVSYSDAYPPSQVPIRASL